MAYDDEVYLPSKYERFGPYGPAITLAHEWGHAMQDAAGINTPPVEEWPPSVLLELQADCFAGAFTGYVLDGDARLELTGGDLDQALAARLTAGDPPGVPSTHERAHGSGFDRVGAFQEGFELGATKCVGFVEDDPPRVTEIPFAEGQDAETEGNMPGDVVLGVTVDVLNDFYSQVEPAYEPIALEDLVEYDSTGPESDLPECGGSQLEKKQVANRLIFCADDGYIGYDLPFLQEVYSNIGDFGVAALMSNVFATYVQTLQEFPGVEDNAENAVLGAGCYSGAFAGAMIADPETGTGGLTSTSATPTGEEQVITLSSGDLDEMIYAFIENDRIRGVDKTADFTFRRVSVLRRGVLRGFESCAEFAEE
jgi:predicted metalloprotease